MLLNVFNFRIDSNISNYLVSLPDPIIELEWSCPDVRRLMKKKKFMRQNVSILKQIMAKEQ